MRHLYHQRRKKIRKEGLTNRDQYGVSGQKGKKSNDDIASRYQIPIA
jgi:hypothetical protein